MTRATGNSKDEKEMGGERLGREVQRTIRKMRRRRGGAHPDKKKEQKP